METTKITWYEKKEKIPVQGIRCPEAVLLRCESQGNKYCLVDHWDLLNVKKQYNTLHEVSKTLNKDDVIPQKLVFDIDVKAKDLKTLGVEKKKKWIWSEDLSSDSLLSVILDSIKRVIKKTYGKKCKDISVDSCCRPEKASFHIYVNDYYVQSNWQARKFTELIVQDVSQKINIDEQLVGTKIFDYNIYGTFHSLRLRDSVKLDDPTPMRNISGHTSTASSLFTYIENCKKLPLIEGTTLKKPKKEKLAKKEFLEEDEEEVVEMIKALVPMLSQERSDPFESWRDVGMCLKGICPDEAVALDLFHEFSSKSDKYDSSDVDSWWEKFNPDGSLKMGSLRHWAKEDSPEDYADYILSSKEERKGKLADLVKQDVQQLELQDTIPFESYLEDYKKTVKTKKSFERWELRTLTDMNRYAHVLTGYSKALVIYRDAVYNDGIKMNTFIIKSKKEFVDTFSKWKYSPYIGENQSSKKESIIKQWIDWEDCSTFSRYVCHPGNAAPNEFNTFEGFAISKENADSYMELLSPKEKKKALATLKRWKNFLLTAWCKNNEESYEYLLNFMAHGLQYPGKRLGTATILRGNEGIGKGMIVQTLGKIYGSNYFFHPSSARDVVGEFNGLLENKFLVFLDECVWGGDKREEGKLKALITEETITINKKGKDQMVRQNCSIFYIASNTEWIIPVGKTARRFHCLEVGDNLYQMSKKEIDEIRLIDPHIVAWFLYNRDISKFNSRHVPKTELLKDQKLRDLHPIEQWWLDKVSDGDNIEKDDSYEVFSFDSYIYKDLLYSLYSSSSYVTPYTKNRIIFWKKLRTLMVDCKEIRTKKKEDGKIVRQLAIKIPSCDECKKMINDRFQQDMFDTEDIEEVEID